MSEYEAFGRVISNRNSFLIRPEWVAARTTSTGAPVFPSYMGEVTGGSPYECASAGLKGIPHMPSLGNQFHGVGDTYNAPQGWKIYADDCVVCRTRIVNTYNWDMMRWEGWRPSATVPPKYVIEEDPI